MKISEAVPEFADLLFDLLKSEDELEHANYIHDLRVRYCSKPDAEALDAFNIYVKDSRAINPVEEAGHGHHYKESIAVSGSNGEYVLDINEFGRIMSIEVLGGKDLYNQIQIRITSK